MRARYYGRMLLGLFIIAVGIIFMFVQSGSLTLDYERIVRETWAAFQQFGPYAIPILLIVLGLGIILRPRGAAYDDPADDERSFSGEQAHYDGESSQSRQSDIRNKLAGNIHIGETPWELKPLQVNQMFGDAIIDLTTADISPGETKITVSVLVGDVQILLPPAEDIAVHVQTSSFLGDHTILGRVEAGLLKNVQWKSAHYGAAPRRLHIRVNVLIGNMRIEQMEGPNMAKEPEIIE